MSDENQIEIPPSFTALFADHSGQRLRTPIAEVRQRRKDALARRSPEERKPRGPLRRRPAAS